jgi:hypothetical protein
LADNKNKGQPVNPFKRSFIAVLINLIVIIIVNLNSSAYANASLLDRLGGAFKYKPEQAATQLSPEAKGLLTKAYADIPEGGIHDYHVHLVGLGTGGQKTWLNPKLLTWKHPIHRLKTALYLSAANVNDLSQADKQYTDRLLQLVRHFGHNAKFHLLGFDHHYNKDGSINYEKSEFYTPNETVVALAEQYPEHFVATVSVHPYRKDWKQALQKWADKNITMVKWLPNAHGINASDPAIDDYYRFLKQHDMVLLTHVGEEQAVEAEEDQALGNPLLFDFVLKRTLHLPTGEKLSATIFYQRP